MDLHYNDNLIYHYAGGMTFAALKRWNEAEEFFEICVSSPAQVPAAIQLEAYKKLILVQLISRGTVGILLFDTSSALTVLLDQQCAQIYKWHFSSHDQIFPI
jgi:COP9 signalosome complex subunit 3